MKAPGNKFKSLKHDQVLKYHDKIATVLHVVITVLKCDNHVITSQKNHLDRV